MLHLLETIVNYGNELIWSTPLIVLLVGTGIYTTFRMGFVQLRQFRHSIDVIRGKYDNPEDEGDINHFQALTTALSATVGIGNIAGVATAIHYGGPGAVFWMWITAFFGMSLKYAECTLAMKYRVFDEVGNAAGGPMYYIEKGMGSKWKWLAVTFAACAIISSFGGGNMNQANTVAVSAGVLGVPAYVSGAIMSILVAAVILGGIRRIGRVTSKLAPAMACLYVMGAMVILILNIDHLPGVLKLIVTEAFNPTAGIGGTAAGVWATTLLWGIKRGLFSNEAGQGSAPIAHAAAKTKEPVREGVVAMIGPFIDTLVICTMTAFVILSAGVWDQKKPVELGLSSTSIQTEGVSATFVAGVTNDLEYMVNDGPMDDAVLTVDGLPFSGTLAIVNSALDVDGTAVVRGKALQNSSALTTWAFEVGFGAHGWIGRWIVTLSVFLFALSTVISWSYYGDRCTQYLFGHKWVPVYRLVYVAFVFVGSVLALEVVWAYGDLALGLMTIPNLIAIIVLSKVVKGMQTDYESREHKVYK